MELLISSVIGLAVVGAAFKVYLIQHQNWIIQDQITDTQQAARSSITMISKHIRMAGHGMPSSVSSIYASNADPDTLMVVYQPPEMCQVSTTMAMLQESAALFCGSEDISCFEENRWAYIYDPASDSGEYFLITGVQPASSTIQHDATPLSRLYSSGSQVFMVQAFRFFIANSDTAPPLLMCEELGEQPQPYADNIENLQFRYVMQSGDTLDVPNQPTLVRRILVEVVAHTDRTDLQFEGEYRRRGFGTEVCVRNLGF